MLVPFPTPPVREGARAEEAHVEGVVYAGADLNFIMTPRLAPDTSPSSLHRTSARILPLHVNAYCALSVY